MSINYETAVNNIKQAEPEILAVVIIEGKENIVYTTQDWDIKSDISKLVSIWDTMYGQSLSIGDKKYAILQSTPERLVATSINEGHIIGAKDEERKIIAKVGPKGNMLTSYIVIARELKSISFKEPYISAEAQLGKVSEGGFPKSWDTPKLREELFKGLIDFFKKGAKLEKPDEYDLKRREQERKKRMEELEKVLQALDLTEEDRYVTVSIKTEFKTDYIYDDFQLLKIKREIQNLIKKEFQIHEPFKIKIIKKL